MIVVYGIDMDVGFNGSIVIKNDECLGGNFVVCLSR